VTDLPDYAHPLLLLALAYTLLAVTAMTVKPIRPERWRIALRQLAPLFPHTDGQPLCWENGRFVTLT
jgi:hypothetical protein